MEGDAGAPRFLPAIVRTRNARAAQAGPGPRRRSPAAPVSRRPRLDPVARGGGGPGSGDVCPRVVAAAADPRRGRARLPAARSSQHARQPAPHGGAPTGHISATRGVAYRLTAV